MQIGSFLEVITFISAILTILLILLQQLALMAIFMSIPRILSVRKAGDYRLYQIKKT